MDHRKIQSRALNILFLAGSLLASGCAEKARDPDNLMNDTGVPYENQTTIATEDLVCESSVTNLVDLANITHIDYYRWSEDGQHVYIISGDDGWDYSVTDLTMESMSILEMLVSPTPSIVEQRYFSLVEDEYESARSRSATSPSGKYLVYCERQDTSELNGIFLLQDDSVEPIFIDQIPGAIRGYHWTVDEEQVVIEMFPLSPEYLWLLDIPTRTLTLLFSQDPPCKNSVLDISPDGDWLLYQTAPVDHVFLLGLHDLSIKDLYGLPRTFGAWWLPDGHRIISVRMNLADSYSINIYDVQSDKLIEIASDLGSGEDALSGAFQLISVSETKVTMANITLYPSPNFYVLDLCISEAHE
jgi:hypothetical protein